MRRVARRLANEAIDYVDDDAAPDVLAQVQAEAATTWRSPADAKPAVPCCSTDGTPHRFVRRSRMIPSFGAISRDVLISVVRALWALSGDRRQWVRADRVVDHARGNRVGSLATVLVRRSEWWLDPEAAEYAALVVLVHQGPRFAEGRGHFGAPDGPPLDPAFNRCRRSSRTLDAVIADLAAVTECRGTAD